MLRKRSMTYILLCILCIITYNGITDNYLFNDDFLWLREARYMMTPGNLMTYRVINFFRPLINLSFFVMERSSAGNLPMHYVFNIVLHFLNCILVFHLILKLLDDAKIALAASVVFAVTSVHSGAVFWISARTTLASTLLLLASLVTFTSNPRNRSLGITISTCFFILALSAKETAITGLPLILLLFLYMRRAGKSDTSSVWYLVPSAVVSIFYLIIRKTLLGGYIQPNWGIGLHIPRNIGGGVLYQFYPWPFFSLLDPSGGLIRASTHPFMPEILSLPLVILLVLVGWKTGRFNEICLAVCWTVISLVPASLFNYRFFSTESFSQNRYYYLSSIGSVLAIVIVLHILWGLRNRILRAAAVVLLVIICCGYIVRVHRIEKKWEHFTEYYRSTLNTVLHEIERWPAYSTVAIENSPMAFRYLEAGIALRRPDLRVVEIEGGAGDADRWRPCLYISYIPQTKELMRMRIEILE